jgi:hypothetical protein
VEEYDMQSPNARLGLREGGQLFCHIGREGGEGGGISRFIC